MGTKGFPGLDAYAELHVALVASVGVEVVGGAAGELVALTDLAAYDEAERKGADAGGDPADGLEEGWLRLGVVGIAEWAGSPGGDGGDRDGMDGAGDLQCWSKRREDLGGGVGGSRRESLVWFRLAGKEPG